ncbi:hypothetical protein B0T10DRAFT_418725, partial [Thelonectria olida]
LAIGNGEHSAKFITYGHNFSHTFAQGGFDNDFNGAQKYAPMDARFVDRVDSSGLTIDEACTIPVIVLAGFIALLRELRSWFFPPPFSPEAKSFEYGDVTLLVIGGGSNTGRATIELARLAGIGRIIAVAGRHNAAKLKSIGAAHVIDRKAPDVLDQIRVITGDELIFAVHTVNAGMEQELGVAALSNTKKGTLITLRRPEGDLDAARIGSKSAGYERRLVFGVSPMHPEVTIGFWEEVRWLKKGKIHPSSFDVIEGLVADAVNEALDRYRNGKGVKTNIHPCE